MTALSTAMMERALKQAIEGNNAAKHTLPADPDFVPEIIGIFVTEDGGIYGFSDHTLFYYDEFEGADRPGGCWEYLHDCKEKNLSIDMVTYANHFQVTRRILEPEVK